MISRLRKQTQPKHQAFIVWCMIVAFAVHSLIPAGFMPDLSTATHKPFAMVICGGMMHHQTPPADNSDHQTQDHMACPFNLHAAMTWDGFGIVALNLVFVTITLSLFTAFVLRQHRRNAHAAPRAPPLFS